MFGGNAFRMPRSVPSRNPSGHLARQACLSLLMAICIALAATVPVVAQDAAARTRNLAHADALTAAGVVRTQTVEVGGATIDLSQPFPLDDSHQIAVAWVRLGAERAIRVLYRSNSQCCWRLCDATTPNHIGKGFHEFDKQVPLALTLALLRVHDEPGTLRPWLPAGQENLSQDQLAQQILRLLTCDRDAGLKSGDVLVREGQYLTHEYASLMPSVPSRFSRVQGHLRAVNGTPVADPAQTTLPAAGQLPDVRHELAAVQFAVPSYASVSGTNGKLTGRVYLSRDKTLHYFFVEDEAGRVMLSGVELVEAPVSILGLRRQYLDVRGMDTPLMEYAAQIPEQFGGRRENRYQLAWPWVRQLPIIQFYYRELHREIPPPNLVEMAR